MYFSNFKLYLLTNYTEQSLRENGKETVTHTYMYRSALFSRTDN